ncbi:MAG: hypothetical protein V2I47_07210 [Bacteroidales bacterium]|jgi:hypothetical protein|nr:hypothetical protein [Bacteroidales bacterium]
METEKKLNKEILRLTTIIHEKYPELVKYLEEFQTTIPDNKALTIDSLREYKNTLEKIIKDYEKDH